MYCWIIKNQWYTTLSSAGAMSNKPTLWEQMAWCYMAPGHQLSQCSRGLNSKSMAIISMHNDTTYKKFKGLIKFFGSHGLTAGFSITRQQSITILTICPLSQLCHCLILYASKNGPDLAILFKTFWQIFSALQKQYLFHLTKGISISSS